MKKKFFTLLATVMVAMSASAFNFDGIDMSQNVTNVMRDIAAKGYVFNAEKNCLQGNCQGTMIDLSFNLTDVKTAGKVGQMVISIPVNAAEADMAYKYAELTLNVVYHKAGENNGVTVFAVDADGSTAQLVKTANGMQLIYNTPFYEKKN